MKNYCFLLSFLFIGIIFLSCDYGGVPPSYRPKENDPMLSEQARRILPIIDSVEIYKKTTGSIPNQEEANKNIFKLRENVDIVYVPIEKKNYRIIIRLGWDPSLIYESCDKQWIFGPGDGSNKIPVTLDIPEQYLPELDI